jgi:aminoglycoside phosphotransferase (APT) family kinase protein
MNYALQFLRANRQRLNLASYGLAERMTSVVVTPRFRASGHVVFLIMSQGRPEPVLVAKAPRIRDAGASLRTEAANLRFLHGLRPEGFSSVPKLIAFEEYSRRPLLVETALIGSPMDPALVRRRFESCCDAVITWLTDLHRARNGAAPVAPTRRLVTETLDYLTRVVSWNAEELRALERTRELLEPLQAARLPAVLEHGDLSHPNVMLQKDGTAGVVDWEMADPRGLPCHDLIFFLTYAAFARQNVRANGQYIPAIREAFFDGQAWARPYVQQYAQELELPPDALTPLFLLCWVRYLAGLLRRLNESGGKFTTETAAWLRQNRYYAAWRHTLDHSDQLHWGGVK